MLRQEAVEGRCKVRQLYLAGEGCGEGRQPSRIVWGRLCEVPGAQGGLPRHSPSQRGRPLCLHGSVGTFSCMMGDIATSCNCPYNYQNPSPHIIGSDIRHMAYALEQHSLQSICRVGQKTHQASQDCLVLSRL